MSIDARSRSMGVPPAQGRALRPAARKDIWANSLIFQRLVATMPTKFQSPKLGRRRPQWMRPAWRTEDILNFLVSNLRIDFTLDTVGQNRWRVRQDLNL